MGNLFVFQHHPHYTLTEAELRQLRKETGFTNNQMDRLFRRFQHLDKDGKGYLQKEDMLHLHEIVLNPIGEKIVDMFFHNSNKLIFEDFVRTFAIFRPITRTTPSYAVNSREAKLKFLFSLVDSNHDGNFSHDEVHDLLEMMMGAKITEEQIDQITTRVIQEGDFSGTGEITLSDFRKVTQNLDLEGNMSFISFS